MHELLFLFVITRDTHGHNFVFQVDFDLWLANSAEFLPHVKQDDENDLDCEIGKLTENQDQN